MPLITKVLKPEQLNAETMAVLYCAPKVDFSKMMPQSQQFQIDQQQKVLDGLVNMGILGE